MSRGQRQAGFTLVELTVALVAGLIVALGITALSREATRTFHEEVRTSAAEATLRTAIDRLRADLQRASYMSTPNAVRDTRIAAPPGTPGIPVTAPASIRRLAGILLYQGWSAANNNIPLSASQQPPQQALTPDAIEIGGNMTCAEQFEIQYVKQVGNCARLELSATSPAVYRINAIGPAGNNAQELNNVFQPDGASQFIVRILDDTGRSQFLPTCVGGVGITTGFDGTSPFVVVSLVAPNKILAPADTNGLGGITTTPGGRAWVNPVNIVRWEITNAANEPAQYTNALANQSIPGADGGADPNKYDLIRSYLDVAGNVIPATTEVVAEYAVDLKFAFSVENSPNPTTPAMASFTFDDATNQTWASNVLANQLQPQQPEFIRSVRVRVATRAAQADRTAYIPVDYTNTVNGTGTYLYRYCILAPCDTVDGTLRWARARTITTEVSLPNQAGAFF